MDTITEHSEDDHEFELLRDFDFVDKTILDDDTWIDQWIKESECDTLNTSFMSITSWLAGCMFVAY